MSTPSHRPHVDPFRRLMAGFLALVGTAGLIATPSFGSDLGSQEGATPKMPRTESPKGAQVYFITPKDGETLTSPITVRFGLKGMGVAPAGVHKQSTGHHHLIVDAELPPANLPIPATDHYRHFGMGQSEVDLELAPGKHTLQLLLGDLNHIPHDPPVVSDQITVTVE